MSRAPTMRSCATSTLIAAALISQALGQTAYSAGEALTAAEVEAKAGAGDTDHPRVVAVDVQCETIEMRVRITFDRPFRGVVFSKGHFRDPECVYVREPATTVASFVIAADRCGFFASESLVKPEGQPNPSGAFVENTIIVQYDPQVQEAWDEAKKIKCTWHDFYEKNVAFQPFQVGMLNAVTSNFLGDNLQCWMQIQAGKGPWAAEVNGIVKIGQTMTMVLGIFDEEDKFDMLVRNCVAHDGVRAPIQLVDGDGCIVRHKIMSDFQKVKNFGQAATVVSYAYFQAFKFPDAMDVHFQCVIQVCRFSCPPSDCQGSAHGPAHGPAQRHRRAVDAEAPFLHVNTSRNIRVLSSATDLAEARFHLFSSEHTQAESTTIFRKVCMQFPDVASLSLLASGVVFAASVVVSVSASCSTRGKKSV